MGVYNGRGPAALGLHGLRPSGSWRMGGDGGWMLLCTTPTGAGWEGGSWEAASLARGGVGGCEVRVRSSLVGEAAPHWLPSMAARRRSLPHAGNAELACAVYCREPAPVIGAYGQGKAVWWAVWVARNREKQVGLPAVCA